MIKLLVLGRYLLSIFSSLPHNHNMSFITFDGMDCVGRRRAKVVIFLKIILHSTYTILLKILIFLKLYLNLTRIIKLNNWHQISKYQCLHQTIHQSDDLIKCLISNILFRSVQSNLFILYKSCQLKLKMKCKILCWESFEKIKKLVHVVVRDIGVIFQN